MNRFLPLLFAVCSVAASAQNSAEQLITKMHDRYQNSWYRTLTFEQQSITHKPDGTTSTELWHEAMLVPGKLRIDFGDPKNGNGVLFANNRQYVYKSGKLANDKDRIHPLLVLGFDVYGQPVATTLQQLKDLHIDLATTHEEKFEGRSVVVVGAKSGDTTSPQFWIDKERLYFVRLLQPDDKDPKTTEDIRFDDYKKVSGGGWVAEHVAVYSEGKLVFEEKYSDVKVNPTLKNDLFDPQHFSQSGE
jgi:outer membrane lipoprotein-sorting protein